VDGFDINTTVSDQRESSTNWIYPNPTNGARSVQVNGSASDPSVTIVDMLGVVRIVDAPTNNSINISDLESGMYCVVITSAHEVHQQTLIITK
jgi:Secretion system C-terminal sorting domain